MDEVLREKYYVLAQKNLYARIVSLAGVKLTQLLRMTIE